ncbi:(d)CMP kinase [Nanoarchaeota archaeon]
MIITLSGTAGSGKSTVGKILAQKLNLKHYSTGDFMRKMAREKNLSLEELGKIAEGDRSIDTALDEQQIELAEKEDDFIMDGRLSFKFLPKSIKIFLDGDLKVRAQRIWHDITVRELRKEERAENIREIIEEMQTREQCEKTRYLKYYDIDPYDMKHYDLVVDTSNINAEEVADKIVEFVKQKE